MIDHNVISSYSKEYPKEVAFIKNIVLIINEIKSLLNQC